MVYKRIKRLLGQYGVAALIRKIDDRYGFQVLVRMFTGHWFNPFATIYVNLRCFPVRQAVKFPMFVYGSPGLYHLAGWMRIEGQVSMGMIRFNKTSPLMPCRQQVNSEISLLGGLIFRGKVRIGNGTRLLIQNGAILDLGDGVKITDDVNIGCHKSVKIGNHSIIAHRCQIQESNHHFIIDTVSRIVNPAAVPVNIGDYCWICNSSTITGGQTFQTIV